MEGAGAGLQQAQLDALQVETSTSTAETYCTRNQQEAQLDALQVETPRLSSKNRTRSLQQAQLDALQVETSREQ